MRVTSNTNCKVVVLSALNAFGPEHSGPKPVLDPSQWDGGVSAFYLWDKEVPETPGKLLRQEELPPECSGITSAKM